ncbi:hypothetical protein Tco_0900368 [Tanacetum coccineum]
MEDRSDRSSVGSFWSETISRNANNKHITNGKMERLDQEAAWSDMEGYGDVLRPRVLDIVAAESNSASVITIQRINGHPLENLLSKRNLDKVFTPRPWSCLAHKEPSSDGRREYDDLDQRNPLVD